MKHSRKKLVYNRDQEHHLRKKERKKETKTGPSLLHPTPTNQPKKRKKRI
jgi:hypothetical protein